MQQGSDAGAVSVVGLGSWFRQDSITAARLTEVALGPLFCLLVRDQCPGLQEACLASAAGA